MNPLSRPRRNRKSAAIRNLVRETVVLPSDLVMPLFVMEGRGEKSPIKAMPGIERMSIDVLVGECRQLERLGISAVALFPVIEESLKNPTASESKNPEGLYPRAIQAVKEACPEMCVISDVALDPYNSDGHDGIVRNGIVVNDETVEILGEMAVLHARSGADVVAPSDMMDGRVGSIRYDLDTNGFDQTNILSYSAKYASAFYGPFRDALDSAPKAGDKKTYQMDPANKREARLEISADHEEGADMVMIKPALAYLDIIHMIAEISEVPVAAYNVSGEYSMIKAAAENGWLDGDAAMKETLLSIKRAGADIILSYFAKEFAEKF